MTKKIEKRKIQKTLSSLWSMDGDSLFPLPVARRTMLVCTSRGAPAAGNAATRKLGRPTTGHQRITSRGGGVRCSAVPGSYLLGKRTDCRTAVEGGQTLTRESTKDSSSSPWAWVGSETLSKSVVPSGVAGHVSSMRCSMAAAVDDNNRDGGDGQGLGRAAPSGNRCTLPSAIAARLGSWSGTLVLLLLLPVVNKGPMPKRRTGEVKAGLVSLEVGAAPEQCETAAEGVAEPRGAAPLECSQKEEAKDIDEGRPPCSDGTAWRVQRGRHLKRSATAAALRELILKVNHSQVYYFHKLN